MHARAMTACTPRRGRNACRGLALARLLKWIAAGLLVLLVVLALIAWWLVGSQSGARFVLARAVGALDGKLAIGKSVGSLAGPLMLEDLRWNDPAQGIDARVTQLHLDLEPWALLAGQVRVRSLEVAGIGLALRSVPPQPAQIAQPFSLAAPIDIALERLVLRDAQISKDGAPVFAFDRLDAAAAWTSKAASLRSLVLQAPQGRVELQGAITPQGGFPGKGSGSFRWRAGDADYVGTLELQSDGRKATLAFALEAPTRVTLEASLMQTAALPWTLRVEAPGFDPHILRKDVPLDAFALRLEGSGDRQAGNIAATLDLDGHKLELAPLRYAFDGSLLKIEDFTLRAPDIAGTLAANAQLQLDATPPTMDASLRWQGVELPAELAGQRLDSHGELALSGSAQTFKATGAFALGPPGRLADLNIDLDGTPEAITLKQLALKQAKGGLDLQGEITLKPALAWSIDAHAERFDPGALVAQWPGAIDFDLASKGSLGEHGPDATLKLGNLRGQLRERALSGHADLHLQPGWRVDGALELAAGKSRIELAGKGGTQTDATLKLALGALGDWVPGLEGSLDGELRARGDWPALSLGGRVHGHALASGSNRIGALDLDLDLARLLEPQGRMQLELDDVVAGPLGFATLNLEAKGDKAAHELSLRGRGKPLDLDLALAGGVDAKGGWNGTLRTLDLGLEQAPRLTLRAPVGASWQQGQFKLDELCLGSAQTDLCASASGGVDGSGAARYRIEHLPLALLAALGAPESSLHIDGMLDGSGEIQRSASGALSGQARLGSASGALTHVEHAQAPLLTWRDFAFHVELAPESTHARVQAALDHDGKLEGEVALSGAPGSTQALSGDVSLALDSLAFIGLLTPDIVDARGRVRANYRLSGTSSAPQASGALTLEGFAAEIPAAGLKLHEGQMSLRAVDAEHFALDGSLKSGQGTLTLSGSGGITSQAPLQASIRGTDFLALDIPAARVLISPDLRIERNDKLLSVGGSVSIPRTNIDLAKLPGGEAAKSSPDVVVVDAPAVAPARALPVTVAVDIKLGDEVKLAGMGLDGSVSGQLRIDQRPGRQAVGTGTLNAAGSYRAYGQNLVIESGRLLFAGSALDNPGLDIRAVRKIPGASGGQFDDTITAGLQVRGTALLPVLTVFSQPPMEQSEALSYLLTGKPLSSLKSGEGDMLGTAARALGSATGDLLAKGIGARLGLDAGVSDNAALGGAAFTVGKYLSPKLYLSYGVGLFSPGEVVTLKYLFSKRWNFEAQNATTGSRAGLNYRHER